MLSVPVSCPSPHGQGQVAPDTWERQRWKSRVQGLPGEGQMTRAAHGCFLPGALALFSLPVRGLCTLCFSHHHPATPSPPTHTHSGPSTDLLQRARPGGMRTGTNFGVMQVTLAALAWV